jgi:hypothetical protein
MNRARKKGSLTAIVTAVVTQGVLDARVEPGEAVADEEHELRLGVHACRGAGEGRQVPGDVDLEVQSPSAMPEIRADLVGVTIELTAVDPSREITRRDAIHLVTGPVRAEQVSQARGARLADADAVEPETPRPEVLQRAGEACHRRTLPRSASAHHGDRCHRSGT